MKGNKSNLAKLAMLAVIGVALVGLVYKFRHRIEHFHPRLRIRSLETITFSPSALSLPKGSRRRFVVLAHYRDHSQGELTSEVAWTSSNPEVASIDPDGAVTARMEGTSILRADFQKATAQVSISVIPAAPVALAISPADETLLENGSLELKVHAVRSDDRVENVGNQVTWTTSDPAVITVTPFGLAEGHASGTSVVTAQLDTSAGPIRSAVTLTVGLRSDVLAGVYSYRYDNSGTGQNRLETLLTPRTVNATKFGKLFAAPVDGYVYAQPLYVSRVNVAGRGTHNVVYAVTENNTVFAIDADSGLELFRTSLGAPIPKDHLSCLDMGPQIGITGTPVISAADGIMFVAAKVFQHGTSAFYLHAIDIASGKEREGSPVLITATLPGEDRGSIKGEITFDAAPQLQRPGLVLVNGQVVVTFGSICDYGPFHGWLFTYDAGSLKRRAVFLTTPGGSHGGIWQAGGSPVADPQGDIYVITGDGEFDANDGGNDYGDTFLKLAVTSPSAAAEPVDYFTPFDQQEMDTENADLGSSGPMILPDQLGQQSHLLFGAAKNGSMYLVNRDDMGHFRPSNNNQIVQYLAHIFPTKVHVSPAYWSNATSQWIFVSSVGGPLEAFPLLQGRLSPVPSSKTSTSFGYPGATPVISSNGDADGILWALENTTGVLHAFAATDLSHELYNSKQALNDRDTAEHGVQFYVPLVADGKVYFGTRSHVYAYGLLNKTAPN
jgi:Bacterial Ig-like domain (group 2)